MTRRIALCSLGLLMVSALGCTRGFADPSREFAEPLPSERTWPTVVHEPTAYGVLATPLIVDAKDLDVPAGTRCEACHDQAPDPTWQPAPGERYHSNIEIEHGDLSCGQCHDPQTRGLHLADDTHVPWVEVIRLCGQCHGPQFRDYGHNTHGGMNGHWDLRQGPRERNNCVDCHTPHAPAFGKRKPVFQPRDRFLHGLDGGQKHGGGATHDGGGSTHGSPDGAHGPAPAHPDAHEPQPHAPEGAASEEHHE